MQTGGHYDGAKIVILASASPRRRDLLALITPEFEVAVSGADESCDIADPRKMVRFLAEKKAASVAQDYPDETVIGADTVVEAGGEVFGKPADFEDARRMLRALSGNVHFVHTGVCVTCGGRKITEAFTTKVFFRPLDPQEIEEYLAQENVMDKAGAYAIQGSAARFVEGIEGCFFNVVGLPVSGLYGMLKKLDQV